MAYNILDFVADGFKFFGVNSVGEKIQRFEDIREERARMKELKKQEEQRKRDEQARKARANSSALSGNSKAFYDNLLAIKMKASFRDLASLDVAESALKVPFDLPKIAIKKDKKFKDTLVGGFLSDLWGGIKDGFIGGVRNGFEQGIDKVVGGAVGSEGVQSAQDTMAEYGSGLIKKSIKNFFKENWLFILFPILGLIVFTRYLFKKRR